jgi:protein-S-isoprenylcysteine O-methyltransferase Ste14
MGRRDVQRLAAAVAGVLTGALMGSETIFCVTLLLMFLGYIIPRSYYRRKAHHSSPEDQLPLTETTESEVRLALLGVCGLSADLLSIAWAINPQWLAWSNLPLPPWLHWLGLPGAAGTVWLGYLAHRTLGSNYTPDLRTKVGHQVVADGIYGWIRHPMYTSFFALLASYFLLTANWLIGLWGLGYSLLIVERAGHEEQMLIERFGDEYRAYIQRTGRFLPRLKRTTSDAENEPLP